MIEDGLAEDGTEQLLSFLSHALPTETVAVPPVSRISVYSKNISAAIHFDRVLEELQPRPVLIEHADSSPITVKQFVMAAHKFLSQHKDNIIRSESSWYGFYCF
jgi:hypothetical protein